MILTWPAWLSYSRAHCSGSWRSYQAIISLICPHERTAFETDWVERDHGLMWLTQSDSHLQLARRGPVCCNSEVLDCPFYCCILLTFIVLYCLLALSFPPHAHIVKPNLNLSWSISHCALPLLHIVRCYGCILVIVIVLYCWLPTCHNAILIFLFIFFVWLQMVFCHCSPLTWVPVIQYCNNVITVVVLRCRPL